jgi:hypothetical protein
LAGKNRKKNPCQHHPHNREKGYHFSFFVNFILMKSLLLLIFCLTLRLSAQKHVFYLHGRIVELQGAKAIETTNGYGPYLYQAILDSLSARGLQVHSELRPANTEVADYAQKICLEIRRLLLAGVPARDITVIGASKGAAIAMACSALLKNPEIRYVWLAGCCGSEHIKYTGKILSIFEKSDSCGACQLPDEKESAAITEFKEIAINTGLHHGFFYTPRSEWLLPALEWIYSH